VQPVSQALKRRQVSGSMLEGIISFSGKVRLLSASRLSRFVYATAPISGRHAEDSSPLLE